MEGRARQQSVSMRCSSNVYLHSSKIVFSYFNIFVYMYFNIVYFNFNTIVFLYFTIFVYLFVCAKYRSNVVTLRQNLLPSALHILQAGTFHSKEG